jgi:hypothetical protein
MLETKPAVGFSAVLAALAALAPDPAAACSCKQQPPSAYLKQADVVFLGRAGKVIEKSGKRLQPFTVLLPIKGVPGKTFTQVRPKVRPPCDRSYTPGEVAVVFAHKGNIDLCAGNFPMEAQLPHLDTYLGGGKKAAAVDLAALRFALETMLRPYLHDRPRVPVAYAPLAGKKLRIGKTTLPVVRKRGGKSMIHVSRAVSAGDVRLVSGSYGTEGFWFDLLLLKRGATFEVLDKHGAER